VIDDSIESNRGGQIGCSLVLRVYARLSSEVIIYARGTVQVDLLEAHIKEECTREIVVVVFHGTGAPRQDPLAALSWSLAVALNPCPQIDRIRKPRPSRPKRNGTTNTKEMTWAKVWPIKKTGSVTLLFCDGKQLTIVSSLGVSTLGRYDVGKYMKNSRGVSFSI